MLAQFRQQSESKSPEEPDGTASDSELEASDSELDRLTDELLHDGHGQKISALEQQVADLLGQRRFDSDKADFDNIVAIAAKEHADALKFLPEDFVATWFRNQALIDPELVAAFDNRYESPEAYGHAERLVSKAVKRLGKELAALPDPQATEDRAAVAHAMKGTGKPGPEPAPNFGRMTDAELRKYTEQEYGFSHV